MAKRKKFKKLTKKEAAALAQAQAVAKAKRDDALQVHDLLETYQGRADLLAKAILYDLVTEKFEYTPAIQISVVEKLLQYLAETIDENPFRLTLRATKAFRWAVRPEIQTEFGVMFGQSFMGMLDREQRGEIVEMAEYKAYVAKYQVFLEAINE